MPKESGKKMQELLRVLFLEAGAHSRSSLAARLGVSTATLDLSMRELREVFASTRKEIMVEGRTRFKVTQFRFEQFRRCRNFLAALYRTRSVRVQERARLVEILKALAKRPHTRGQLRKIIDERTEPWGINVISVEIKDVRIPPALEDAMSMQAQAERERQARVILGDSERQVAEKFGEASKTYINNPVALHLRAMNMLYEGLKDNATIVIVPSSVIDTMQLGSVAGLSALTMEIGQSAEKKEEKQPADKDVSQ